MVIRASKCIKRYKGPSSVLGYTLLNISFLISNLTVTRAFSSKFSDHVPSENVLPIEKIDLSGVISENTAQRLLYNFVCVCVCVWD